MKEGEGKYYERRKPGVRTGTIFASIFISSYLARDSAFPFKNKDKLHIKIEDDKLIITKETEG